MKRKIVSKKIVYNIENMNQSRVRYDICKNDIHIKSYTRDFKIKKPFIL